MLRDLQITDLALIEDLALEFGPGLNIITGETGAGKSLLQRAVAIALARAPARRSFARALTPLVSKRISIPRSKNAILPSA